MKKYILLFILFICFFSKAQTYTFDYILTYENTNLKNKDVEPFLQQFALNSKNNNYIFFLGTNGLGYIFDHSTNKKHQISIIQNSENGKFVFNYLKTDNIIIEEKKYYSVKKLDKNEYLLQYFEKEKKKKSLIDIKVILKENTENLISIRGDIPYTYTYNLEEKLRSSLDPNKKHIVEKYIFNYKNGYVLQDELQNSTRIDLKIEVPQK